MDKLRTCDDMMSYFNIQQRSSSNPEIQVGENLLQELGIELSKPFIPRKTSRDEAIPQKRITKAHHSSFEVLFDSDTKVLCMIRQYIMH